MVQIGVFHMLLSWWAFAFPFVLAFYVAVYGVMIAIPLLFVDECTFWLPGVRTQSRFKTFVITFLILGMGNWCIYGVWTQILKFLKVDLSGLA